MIPAILSSRRLYGEVPEINHISELDLINSRTRRQILNFLELNFDSWEQLGH